MLSKKTCPRCNKTFICSIGKTCWCNKAELNEKQRNLLREKYFDCLCNTCLIEIYKT